MAVLIGSATLQAMNEEDNEKNKESLAVQLQRIGTEDNVYFAVEEAVGTPNEIRNSILSRRLTTETIDTRRLSNTQRVSRLQVVLERTLVRRDAKNSNVINIIDIRLRKLPGYALDKVVPTFDFEGTTAGLLKALHEKNISIEPELSGVIGDPLYMGNDLSRTVHVKGANLTVREILSQAVATPDYKRLLWVATTKVSEQQPVTFIRFFGVERSRDQRQPK